MESTRVIYNSHFEMITPPPSECSPALENPGADVTYDINYGAGLPCTSNYQHGHIHNQWNGINFAQWNHGPHPSHCYYSNNMAPYQIVITNACSTKALQASRPVLHSPSTKRALTSFTSFQLLKLENEFSSNRYLTRNRKIILANNLHLPEKQIKIWFQNRRMKENKKNKDSSPQTMHSSDRQVEELQDSDVKEVNRLMKYSVVAPKQRNGSTTTLSDDQDDSIDELLNVTEYFMSFRPLDQLDKMIEEYLTE